MKKLISIIAVLILITSCGKNSIFSSNDIEGVFNDYEGEVIYVTYENFDKGIILDTVNVENGEFECDIDLNIDKTPVYILNDKSDIITTLFIKEGETVNLSGSSKPYETHIMGDSTNILLSDFYNENSFILSQYDSVKSEYINSFNDTIYIQKLKLLSDSIVTKSSEFIKSNISSPASTFILYNYVASPSNKSITRELSEKLLPVAKTTTISARIEHFAALQKFDKGKVLPYTQLKTSTDSTIYSYTFLNKITILTFWDSSDSLSVKKIKDITSYYDTLKQKKLVSLHLLSLDIDEDNWLNTLKSTIKEEKTRILNSKLHDGWSNRDIASINLKSVPSVFLLNRNGVIIGRELEFDSLTYLIGKTILNNDSIDEVRKNRYKRNR